jgi:ion channel-forming bestrophin family protein
VPEALEMADPSLVLHPGPLAPHMARRHYLRVLLQLMSRMRFDLLVMVSVCLVSLGLHPVAQHGLIKGSGLPILGIAVSIFVAFRNTQAINRWWEARSLWGAVVNQSRHWRDTLLAVLGPQSSHPGPMGELLQLQVLLVWLLNFELRNFAQAGQRQRVMALAERLGFGAAVTTQQVCRRRAALLYQLHRDGLVSELGRDALLRSAEAFTTAMGGLQKIRNTPIPPAYDVFVRLICWLFGYALFLQFFFDNEPFTGSLLFLGFLVAERIGAYVEGPFDRDGSSFSLPLNLICQGISADLLAHDSPVDPIPTAPDPTTWT